ncbi:tryptophan synthase alpha chain [Sphingomonas jejuensis]|uniref:Tryptophan synthase alpha chain n=1 Tax=Sphingomonas jejuensis TaxID=904715 RepID=A0ABX0XJQ8_9SPHN|nr:tryptophan synthase subunit alpha [Sphingomonas jejuensis]NJC33582.1 tryptophan synthase alpha chain [Sphingomonas jejuensis]
MSTAAPDADGRIAAAFAGAAQDGRAALVTFVTAGDGPTPSILDALVDGGADVIELGMPFTDPMADGAAIQAANIRALDAGTRTADILDVVRGFRDRHPDVPLVLMGYANTMLARGADWFAREAAAAGADGVICVDLPPEEQQDLAPALRGAGLHLVRLVAPTTGDARLAQVVGTASGFVYAVAVAGITGTQQATAEAIGAAATRIRAATDLPVAVGFGIRTPDDAARVARVADGVVVGSAIVDIVAKHGALSPSPVRAFVQSLRTGIDTARQETSA